MNLPRLQLFEIHDETWFPATLRHFTTDFLSYLWCFDGFGTTKASIAPVVDLMSKGIEETDTMQIIDLASGSGQASTEVVKQLRQKGYTNVELLLTDLHPNIEAFQKWSEKYPFVNYETEPVNAETCDIDGCRTFFASFHHFPPSTARAFLKDAVRDKKAGIGIFEMTDRSIWNFVFIGLLAPIWIWLFTPFIRPFKFSRLFFTYIIPIVPLVLWWDGLVSILRTYTEEELNRFIQDIDPENTFEWHIKREVCGVVKVIAFSGYPKPEKSQEKKKKNEKSDETRDSLMF